MLRRKRLRTREGGLAHRRVLAPIGLRRRELLRRELVRLVASSAAIKKWSDVVRKQIIKPLTVAEGIAAAAVVSVEVASLAKARHTQEEKRQLNKRLPPDT